MDPEMMAAIFGANPGTMGLPPEVLQSAGGAFNGQAPAATPTPGVQPNSLLSALKGVPALAPPVAQKVSTPAAPKIEPIKSGNLMALLQSLGMQGQDLTKNYQLPSTLAGALGGR